jgi:hypothetical protein
MLDNLWEIALTLPRLVWFYAFMRTTVELPPELMKAAKARAAAQGESLKTLLARAVASELGQSRHLQAGAHVRLPLFGDPKKKPVKTTSETIARALADDDAIAFTGAKRQRKK